MMNKPFSQACENNKRPIFDVLVKTFSKTKHVLEIGSGTGQHALFFSQQLPHLTWQSSDLSVNHQGINAWLNEATWKNVERPIIVDLYNAWPATESNKGFDGLYTANTLHIISWPLVIKFFEGITQNLALGASICIYGPFNYEGKFTSESNATFDLWLKEKDIESGIRDIEAILLLATSAGLTLLNDQAMPANNRLLVFSKTT
jgi:cyclopropane fatty-acyl-phospholipid synthase-like methyltransferase